MLDSFAIGRGLRIAVLVPCLNEGAAIGKVVRELRAALPTSEIYVYDNASTDDTATRAAEAGATVRYETLRGKGNVVRRMFADIDADVYVMIDGDDSYDPEACRKLVEVLVQERYDMVVGARQPTNEKAHRAGHQTGAALLQRVLRALFGGSFTDIFSGQRAFSRRFVKSFPATATGFEVETELSIYCLQQRARYAEVPVRFRERFAGTSSKLRTVRDGARILWTIFSLLQDEKPLTLFGSIFAGLALLSIALAAPLFVDFWITGEVARLPTAVLATGIMLLGFLNLAIGLLLSAVALSRREHRRLFYLASTAGLASRSLQDDDDVYRSDADYGRLEDPLVSPRTHDAPATERPKQITELT